MASEILAAPAAGDLRGLNTKLEILKALWPMSLESRQIQVSHQYYNGLYLFVLNN